MAGDLRILTQVGLKFTTRTLTRTPPNNDIKEQNDSSARAF